MSQQGRLTRRSIWTAVSVIVLLFVLACLGFPVDVPFVVLYVLVTGSVTFLWRVVPQIQVRWDLLVSTAVYALLLLVGSHFFLRWLHSKVRPDDAPWRLGWTLRGIGLVLLMFVSGTAMVGITHQTVWLARSPEPMFRQSPRRERANRLKCTSNLRNIGAYLYIYAKAHDGNYPDDLRPLVLNGDLTGSSFICPSANHEPASSASSREAADSLLKPEHISYLYFGKGLKEPVDANQIIAIDKPENHGNGINVLFGDGRVEWQEGETMRKTLAALNVPIGGTQPSTNPAR